MKGKAVNLKDDGRIDAIKWSARKQANGKPPPEVQRHWDAVQPGLILAVRRAPGDKRQTGRKTWQLRFDTIEEGRKKQSIVKIGNFPAMGLIKARERAAELRENAQEGHDVKSTLKSGSAGLDTTVSELFDQFCSPPKKKAKETRFPLYATSKQYRYGIEKNFHAHVEPVFGHLPIGKVTEQHWINVIDRLRYEEGLPGAASNVLNVCGVFYKNLKRHADPAIKKIRNPVDRDSIKSFNFKRDRVLDIEELKALWNGFDNELHQSITRVLILTGQRISEVLRMRWDRMVMDDDTEIWIVGTKGEMKVKDSAHHLPLTDPIKTAIAPMHEFGSEWVYPGNNDKALSHGAYLLALGRYIKRAGCEHFTPHTLRHTFMTLKSKAGVNYFDAETVMHHSLQSTGAKYDHSQHLHEKERALNQWADYLKRRGIDV